MGLKTCVYRLERFMDDPRYDGFVGGRFFLDSVPQLPDRKGPWQIKRLAPTWIPPTVTGRVRKFHDYPCVNIVYPAFSDRAVAALRDFLEPNGELLPLVTPEGSYFAYNITTVADVLDLERSKIKWSVKPFATFWIDRYEFFQEKLKGLAIFRLPADVSSYYVTEAFVARAREHGLRGMHFQKVWPLPRNMSWERLAREQKEAEKAKDLAAGKTVKGNTVVIRLALADRRSKGTKVERQAVNRLIDELDKRLIDVDSDAPAKGSFEGHDYGVLGECRLFLSTPDADDL